MKFADFTDGLKGQKMFQILSKAKELEKSGKNVIHLEIGDPDFNSPEIAKESIKRSIDNNITHYVQSSGLPILKDACIRATFNSRGFAPSHDQLLVTSGANIQIYLAIACLVNPGDEIIIPDPSFVSYSSIIHSCRATAKFVPLLESNSFKLDPKDIEKQISNKTKAIIINSPHNPTGSVLGEDSIKSIYNICSKNGIYLISDEVYGRMIFNDFKNKFFSASQIDKCRERTILIHSFSKTFAMTGWRIGAVTGPKLLIKKMELLFETITSCVPPFIQIAAAEVLDAGSNITNEMIKEYQSRRDLLIDGLNSIKGIKCAKSEGTFYAFANIKSIINDSETFSNKLLNEDFIATCPGVYFGNNGQGYVRFCFANSKSNINVAIERMARKFNY